MVSRCTKIDCTTTLENVNCCRFACSLNHFATAIGSRTAVCVVADRRTGGSEIDGAAGAPGSAERARSAGACVPTSTA